MTRVETSREMMEIMLDDWVADHAADEPNEMENVVIDRDTIHYNEDDGLWECDAHDDRYAYTMYAYDGDICIEYSGSLR
jgi:hypothetical protein